MLDWRFFLSQIKQVQGQIRTQRLAIQARYKTVLNDDHKIMTWLVPHAAETLNRYLIGVDGKTARQRLKGRTFKSPVVEFGECVWYLKPKSAGRDKLTSRWGTGVWLGVREESGEPLIGTAAGVIKVRSIRRKAGDARWDESLFNAVEGTPWEPVPGRDSIEPPIKIGIPEEDKVVIPPPPVMSRPIVRRDFKIFRTDVRHHGLTPGCKGCQAADAGHPIAKNHSPECRERLMPLILASNPDRIARVGERHLRDLELENRQEINPAPEVEMEAELPQNDDERMDDDDDDKMLGAIYSISADEPLSQRLLNASKTRPEGKSSNKDPGKTWDNDVKRMNAALAKEGLEHSIIEVYSPKRVTGMAELMGLVL